MCHVRGICLICSDMFLNTATEHDNDNSAEDNLHKLLLSLMSFHGNYQLSYNSQISPTSQDMGQ